MCTFIHGSRTLTKISRLTIANITRKILGQTPRLLLPMAATVTMKHCAQTGYKVSRAVLTPPGCRQVAIRPVENYKNAVTSIIGRLVLIKQAMTSSLA